MKVSVIVPVYNVERYLERCLDSVMAATDVFLGASADAAVELICVNDGTRDSSGEILKRYAFRASDPSRFASRILEKTNGGLGSARNAGLDVATGDYVLFVDSDDVLPSRAIACFAAVAAESGADLVVSMSTLSDRDGIPPDLPFAKPRWRLMASAGIAGHKVQYCAWNKFYSRTLVGERRFPKGVYEDFSWTTGILCDLDSFAAIADPLYVYCLNSGSVSLVRSGYTDSKNADSMAAIRRVLDYAKGRTSFAFALRQAADGLSSTVGQVYKSRDAAITRAFLVRFAELLDAYPVLSRRLTLKARFRLWRLKRRNGGRN